MSEIAYLACPYSDPNAQVKKMRHIVANFVAFELMQAGTLVYSPLTHNVPIDEMGIHGNWFTWKTFDHGMLSRCDKVIVLTLPGWDTSKGVAAEMECAKELGKPIEMKEVSAEKIQRAENIVASPFADLIQRMSLIYSERDWHQFHSPKNLAMKLGAETGELMEHFSWLTEEQSFITNPDTLKEIHDEIADVFLMLAYLSYKLKINPLQAAKNKLSIVEKRYPVEKAKGNSLKYTHHIDS